LENHALVFQRFRQVEPGQNEIYTGSGLGLSISKALVEKLGGAIWVTSELGKGSTFTFSLPYLNNNTEVASSLNKGTTNQVVNWNEKTILIVEDEIYNHLYLEEMLLGTKAKILHASDGQESVDNVINHADISLVLMDIKMPVMDGYEAMRVIKKIRPHLPIIAQTAFALSQDEEVAMDAGFDNYLSKPIDKNHFIEVLSNYLS
jgi:CheY-like chemotaxis protein